MGKVKRQNWGMFNICRYVQKLFNKYANQLAKVDVSKFFFSLEVFLTLFLVLINPRRNPFEPQNKSSESNNSLSTAKLVNSKAFSCIQKDIEMRIKSLMNRVFDWRHDEFGCKTKIFMTFLFDDLSGEEPRMESVAVIYVKLYRESLETKSEETKTLKT